jgi:hypothetical protein
VLGWDEVNWEIEENHNVVATEMMKWSDLSIEQQEAALALGYAQDRWDDVSEPTP